MAKVEFNYKGTLIEIQCNPDNKMKDICQKFCEKAGVKFNSVFFLYDGEKMNNELSLKEILNNNDKKEIK